MKHRIPSILMTLCLATTASLTGCEKAPDKAAATKGAKEKTDEASKTPAKPGEKEASPDGGEAKAGSDAKAGGEAKAPGGDPKAPEGEAKAGGDAKAGDAKAGEAKAGGDEKAAADPKAAAPK